MRPRKTRRTTGPWASARVGMSWASWRKQNYFLLHGLKPPVVPTLHVSESCTGHDVSDPEQRFFRCSNELIGFGGAGTSPALDEDLTIMTIVVWATALDDEPLHAFIRHPSDQGSEAVCPGAALDPASKWSEHHDDGRPGKGNYAGDETVPTSGTLIAPVDSRFSGEQQLLNTAAAGAIRSGYYDSRQNEQPVSVGVQALVEVGGHHRC